MADMFIWCSFLKSQTIDSKQQKPTAASSPPYQTHQDQILQKSV